MVTDIFGNHQANMILGERLEGQVYSAELDTIEEEVMQDLTTYVEYLCTKSALDSAERGVVLSAVHAVKDHLVREAKDAGTMTDRKWAPKELLGEAERVLLRANSGLSLLERLRRDAKLRDEFSKLLYQMASDPEVAKEQLSSKYSKRKKPERDAEPSTSMRDVPIS
ncbi:MAG: hypothetical protein SVM80_11875 [Halobacteriota archaeon]|nr:hypothetical protein [Halobacteriota archaeon]